MDLLHKICSNVKRSEYAVATDSPSTVFSPLFESRRAAYGSNIRVTLTYAKITVIFVSFAASQILYEINSLGNHTLFDMPLESVANIMTMYPDGVIS